jgi:hypothetical protein
MINNVPPDQIAPARQPEPAGQRHPVEPRDLHRAPHGPQAVQRQARAPGDELRDRSRGDIQGTVRGLAPVARAPLPSGVFAAHTGLTPYPYDPERAKKLLAEAGATGATFNLGAPNGRYLLDKQVGEAIAGYLDAVACRATARR